MRIKYYTIYNTKKINTGDFLNLISELNSYGKNKKPFFFIINYDMTKWDIIELENLPSDILYSIDKKETINHNLHLETIFEDYLSYKNKFNNILKNIKNGNTYLINFTSKTKILNNVDLKKTYINANAKYKLFYKDKFTSFSPETFVTICNNKINAFPMKGTINANINDAKNILLNDEKELAEHTMIVDLIRNDLSIVASNIKVESFRYIDKIKAGNNELLQASSHISGTLNNSWHENIGDLIVPLLPAGSITGTPKKKTLEIISNIEDFNREYFTGIWGVYDGNTLDSSVLIRFIQKENNSFVYKSGGGITIDSICQNEYQEMKDKVYVP